MNDRDQQQEADPGKFRGGQAVYVQGQGSKEFIVLDRYICGFYRLTDTRTPVLCPGRYGQAERKMYREEEVSSTPWGEKKLPAYESVSSSSGRAWYCCKMPQEPCGKLG